MHTRMLRNTQRPKLTVDTLPEFSLLVEYGEVENTFSGYEIIIIYKHTVVTTALQLMHCQSFLTVEHGGVENTFSDYEKYIIIHT